MGFSNTYRRIFTFESPSHVWIALHRLVEAACRTLGTTFTIEFEQLERRFAFVRTDPRRWPDLATMRRAHELGVSIAMGTDAGTPGNHHGMNAHEVVFMVNEMGMTPAEAIASSTINPARLLRRPGTHRRRRSLREHRSDVLPLIGPRPPKLPTRSARSRRGGAR